jgi:hypothetical protein
MRSATVLFILLGHLLTIAAGRCQTIWHEELDGNSFDTAIAQASHDRDHPRHEAVFFGFGADHDHPEETPDHSHMPVPPAALKATRVQIVLPELISPFAYVELCRILQPLHAPTRHQFAYAPSVHPPCVIPLSGSTTHLLF